MNLIQQHTAPMAKQQNWNIHFIRHFLALKGGKSLHTAEAYERDILDFFRTASIEDIQLNQVIAVNLGDVENYLMELEGAGFASATINRKLSSLSSLYSWLQKYQDNQTGAVLIRFNPFAHLKEEKPNVSSQETPFLTKEECQTLLGSFDPSKLVDLRNKTLLALALSTALRKSELIGIRLRDLKNVADIHVVEVTRKGRRKDQVKIQEAVFDLITEYISRTNRSIKTDGNTYLFLGHAKNGCQGEKLSPSTLNYMMKTVCKRAGIEKNLTVHSTRHTAITLAITEGATIEKVRDFASHASITTTNRYIHSIDRLKNNAGDLIDLGI